MEKSSYFSPPPSILHAWSSSWQQHKDVSIHEMTLVIITLHNSVLWYSILLLILIDNMLPTEIFMCGDVSFLYPFRWESTNWINDVSNLYWFFIHVQPSYFTVQLWTILLFPLLLRIFVIVQLLPWNTNYKTNETKSFADRKIVHHSLCFPTVNLDLNLISGSILTHKRVRRVIKIVVWRETRQYGYFELSQVKGGIRFTIPLSGKIVLLNNIVLFPCHLLCTYIACSQR